MFQGKNKVKLFCEMHSNAGERAVRQPNTHTTKRLQIKNYAKNIYLSSNLPLNVCRYVDIYVWDIN